MQVIFSQKKHLIQRLRKDSDFVFSVMHILGVQEFVSTLLIIYIYLCKMLSKT